MGKKLSPPLTHPGVASVLIQQVRNQRLNKTSYLPTRYLEVGYVATWAQLGNSFATKSFVARKFAAAFLHSPFCVSLEARSLGMIE